MQNHNGISANVDRGPITHAPYLNTIGLYLSNINDHQVTAAPVGMPSANKSTFTAVSVHKM